MDEPTVEADLRLHHLEAVEVEIGSHHHSSRRNSKNHHHDQLPNLGSYYGKSRPGTHGNNFHPAEATPGEFPRLIGTKSQASTASSSATRDSGISVNDLQKAEEALLKEQMHRKASRGSGGSNSMISVDDLPVSGRALSIGKRPGTNRSTISYGNVVENVSSENSSATGSQKSLRGQGKASSSYSRSISGGSAVSKGRRKETNGFTVKDEPEVAADVLTPPRSPLAIQSSNHILLKPADDSPFASANQRNRAGGGGGSSGFYSRTNGASSTNSTPYSQVSIPSSYDYEDDFTSDSESEMSLLPTAYENNVNR